MSPISPAAQARVAERIEVVKAAARRIVHRERQTTHVIVGDHDPEPREEHRPYRLSDRVATGVVRYDGQGILR